MHEGRKELGKKVYIKKRQGMREQSKKGRKQ